MGYQSKRKWKRTGLILLIVLALAGTFTAVYEGYVLQQKEEEIFGLKEELSIYGKMLYVSARELSAGEIITAENVERRLRYSDEDSSLYITSEDFGKILTTDMKEGVCLLKSMLRSEKENLREVVISEIDMPEYLQAGNRVDIRISFGNAEDYIVLSEKMLVSCDEKAGIVLKMAEEEILLLSSALYDCEMYRDTKLYLVKYPEHEQMEKSAVNYIPTTEILAMLDREDAALQRGALEKRMEQLLTN